MDCPQHLESLLLYFCEKGNTGEVQRLCHANSGSYSSSNWEAISSTVFQLCCLWKGSRWHPIYCGCSQQDSLHWSQCLPSVSSPTKYLGLWVFLSCVFMQDFHKKFAPRCSVCEQPIMPEPGQEETVRVVALDRSFHVNCYKCEVRWWLYLLYFIIQDSNEHSPLQVQIR